MSDLPLVLMTHTLPADWLTSLERKCRILKGPIDATMMESTLYEHLPEAQGLFTLLTIPIGEKEISQAPNLRVVSNMAVGVDNIDVSACTQRRIPVGNTPGVLTEGTADLTMALLLSAARGLPQASLDAREGRWRTWSPTGWLGMDLSGATLGIVGMGKIGRAVAERAAGFGMHMLYCDPNTYQGTLAKKCSFEEILRQSDFISLHMPLNAETRHLMSRKAFELMKAGAILVNASRGAVVDTDALYEALRDRRIAGAALDVTDPEPLPPDHPLYALPNCLIVPHIGSATWNTRRRMAELACENLLAGLQGKRLPYCVNPEVYGR
jgi:phosphoglycerate dehydrogenase-like enzyme